MSLLSKNTPYSNRYVSTPFENSGKLRQEKCRFSARSHTHKEGEA